MAKLKRQHELVIRLRFDKPCTAATAQENARDCIHGVFYTSQWEDNQPEEFTVKSFKTKPRKVS